MTTVTNFVPSNVAPFQFQPELDGATYNCVVTWNLFGRRYYISCYDLSGNRIFTVPLIGSPADLVLQTLEWDSGVATASAEDPHGYPPGATVRLTITGANPNAYNGTFDCLVIDATTFTYAVTSNPGPLVSAGAASKNINMAGGYFNSVLVYRTPNRQFEVSP